MGGDIIAGYPQDKPKYVFEKKESLTEMFTGKKEKTEKQKRDEAINAILKE